MRRSRQFLVISIAVLAFPAVALALGDGSIRIVRNGSGFDRTAALSAAGRSVRISGPVNCTRGGRIRIDVTITQRTTGTVAKGTWRARCVGPRRWTLRAARALTGAFEAGDATACAAAAAANAKRATDAIQWCRLVRLAG
jgi:hypothetical protein